MEVLNLKQEARVGKKSDDIDSVLLQTPDLLSFANLSLSPEYWQELHTFLLSQFPAPPPGSVSPTMSGAAGSNSPSLLPLL